MHAITVKGAGGVSIPFYQHEGINYPKSVNTESVINLDTFSVREDDVFISSYPKSGTHWLWETTRMIKAGRLLDDRKEMSLCLVDQAPRHTIDLLPSPRVLTTHMRLAFLSPDIIRKGCKIIYIIRNPKDVIVSYYNFMQHQEHYDFYSGKWKNYLEPSALGKLSYGSWFDHVLSWEEERRKHPSISFIYYEDLKEDPLREMRRLARILGTHQSEDFLAELSDFSKFSNVRQRKQVSSVDDGACNKTYRKGEVGDWKNWFTVSQNEWFDDLYRERMQNTELKVRFTLE